MAEYILVINPGSTSTKVAVYNGEKELHSSSIDHPAEDLRSFTEVNDQLQFRKRDVLAYLKSQNLRVTDLSAIAARGGVLGQLESGAYLVNEAFVEASLHSPAPHPSNLAAVIGYEMIRESGAEINTYIYDAVCGCGTPEPLFTYTGVPEIKKPFVTHVLNSRAVSIEQAKRDGKELEETCYIVCHLGGGVTSNLVKEGKILEFVGDDEGGFSPERSGGVPCRELVKYCFRSGLSEKEVQKRLKGQGGLTAYLGVNDARAVEKMAFEEKDKKAREVYDAMIMQLSKDIGSLAPVVCGNVDKIILTGGMAYSEYLTEEMKKRVGFIAPVAVIPGTYEMEALAKGIHRVLNGKEKAHIL